MNTNLIIISDIVVNLDFVKTAKASTQAEGLTEVVFDDNQKLLLEISFEEFKKMVAFEVVDAPADMPVDAVVDMPEDVPKEAKVKKQV